MQAGQCDYPAYIGCAGASSRHRGNRICGRKLPHSLSKHGSCNSGGEVDSTLRVYQLTPTSEPFRQVPSSQASSISEATSGRCRT